MHKQVTKTYTFDNLHFNDVTTHLRVDSNPSDATYISGLTHTAISVAENYLNYAIAPTQNTITVDRFSGSDFNLFEKNANITGATFSVNGEAVTLDYYERKTDFTYFKFINYYNNVTLTVTYSSGSSTIDLPIKSAILIKVAELYDNDRSGYIMTGSKSNIFELMLNNYRPLIA